MFQIPKEKHVLASDKSEMKIQRYPKAILSCDNIENCKDTSYGSKWHPSGAKLFSACANLESLDGLKTMAFFLEKMEGFHGILPGPPGPAVLQLLWAPHRSSGCTRLFFRLRQCRHGNGWHGTLQWPSGNQRWQWKIHENPWKSPINEGFNGTIIYVSTDKHGGFPSPRLPAVPQTLLHGDVLHQESTLHNPRFFLL